MLSMTGIKPDSFAIDARPGRAKQFEAFLVASELHADLIENPVGVGFEAAKFQFAKQLIGR